MAIMQDLQGKSDIKDIKQVVNYLYQLEDQIRYALGHIDENNISANSISQEMLAPALKQNIQTINIDMANVQRTAQQLVLSTGALNTRITETAAGISRDMADLESGLRATIVETAQGLQASISNNAGNITQLQATAQGLQASISNNAGNITQLQATAQGLQTAVSQKLDTATYTTGYLQTAQSIGLTALGIDFTSATGRPIIKGTGFTISVNGVDIDSTGAFTVDTTNFKLDSQGNLEITGVINAEDGGNIGGFTVNNGQLYGLSGRTIISDGIITMMDANGNIVFNASSRLNMVSASRLEVDGVDVTDIADGWIKDAEIQNGRLVLTKWDGSTVTYPA